MENKENRGLIDKNYYENQLVPFFSSVLELSLPLSLLDIELSWSTLVLDQERQRRKEEGRSKQGRAGSSKYNKILCRYRFASVFSLLDLACMVLHVVLCYYGMGFARHDNVLSLVLPFPDSHGAMGFSFFG